MADSVAQRHGIDDDAGKKNVKEMEEKNLMSDARATAVICMRQLMSLVSDYQTLILIILLSLVLLILVAVQSTA